MIAKEVRDLARLLIRHSTALAPGENVLIESTGAPSELIQALVQEADAAGGVPCVLLKDNEVLREMYSAGSAEAVRARVALMSDIELHAMKQMQAYIGVRQREHQRVREVPQEKMKLYQDLLLTPVHFQTRVPKTWVVLWWPTPSMAQQAGCPRARSRRSTSPSACRLRADATRGRAVQALMETTDRAGRRARHRPLVPDQEGRRHSVLRAPEFPTASASPRPSRRA